VRKRVESFGDSFLVESIERLLHPTPSTTSFTRRLASDDVVEVDVRSIEF
jgi:hypothetical protein|tara:strand:- start:6719 stop:6868 length:150 start_codon:yes stop_codon:yes gene_type:complete